MNDKYYIYYYGQDGAVEKHIEDTWDGLFDQEMLHFSKEQVFVHKTTNPYIWCEAGITEQDINDYEFANAVPAAKMEKLNDLVNFGVIKTGEQYLEILEILESSSLVDTYKREYFAEVPEKHQCTCDSILLFREGCKCGGV